MNCAINITKLYQLLDMVCDLMWIGGSGLDGTRVKFVAGWLLFGGQHDVSENVGVATHTLLNDRSFVVRFFLEFNFISHLLFCRELLRRRRRRFCARDGRVFFDVAGGRPFAEPGRFGDRRSVCSGFHDEARLRRATT
jgi:hypothetical protein